MEKMIKLAAFDVDGTLRDRHGMPASTKEALRSMKEHGIQLALCTGRSEYEMASLQQELGLEWAITCNGSHVGYKGKTVLGTAFPSSLVQSWLKEADRQGHELLLYGAASMYINRSDAPLFRQAQEEIGFLEPLLIHSPESVPAIYQCIVFCEESEEAAYTTLSEESLYVHRWRPWAVDFNPAGMNKAAGLEKLLAHLGLTSEEAAAFGDGLNDLEMMELVGTAVVMGNGCDELKALATHVTKPLHEDGIAYAVDRWILPRQA
jgi:Cof subfamily protein (haloacid dehalogenase superfamily)